MTWRSTPLPRGWHSLRRQVLSRDPICRICHIAKSTEVDHTGAPDDHRLTLLQGLCTPCHRVKTASQINAVIRGRQRPRGTSQISGQSVRKATDSLGASVVQGHSHRMGLYFHSASAGGQVLRTRIGVEAGHLMDMRLASYLKGGSGNWQQGLPPLHIEGDVVTPALVPVLGNGFTVQGSRYAVPRKP